MAGTTSAETKISGALQRELDVVEKECLRPLQVRLWILKLVASRSLAYNIMHSAYNSNCAIASYPGTNNEGKDSCHKHALNFPTFRDVMSVKSGLVSTCTDSDALPLVICGARVQD